MTFDPKLGVHRTEGMRFTYDADVFGPQPELRRLDDIRRSLRDPECQGPDPVYSIVMDVGRNQDCDELRRRMLLFGVVTYAAGRLGHEPVRSQGHVHAVAPHCGWSTPEIFEVWEGEAIIYAQERASDDPGSCVAILAHPGQKVVVPPRWAHCVINADPETRMTFGAWCDRQYGFLYDEVRARSGLAWFPLLDAERNIHWDPNPKYSPSRIAVREPRPYPELGLSQAPMYEQFVADPESVQWVSDPGRLSTLWHSFEP
jgi:glucose-6-phosphate isomerase, archaeal